MDFKEILKLISENLNCGIFIVDKYGKVVFYNKSVNDLAGLNVENAVGKHILEIFPRLTEETSTIVKVLKTGTPIKDYVQNYYNYKDKYVTILSSSIPIYEGGRLEGVVEIFSDVKKYNNFNRTKENYNDTCAAVYTIDDIIGSSSEKKELKDKIRKTADSFSPVLVYGETGTGKELVVQSLHNESSRRDKPFIAQDCAAIPETLFESMLFGTKLGSFTGAKDSKGLIEAADGGTLFLDEINSMNITLQAKLLRFLQESKIRRLGDNTLREVNVRIVAAMNEDPYKAIESGRLRSDLFYRLNVINFSLLPLRDSRCDIEELSVYFLNHFNKKLDKKICGFSSGVSEFFQRYDWPGNVRELKHVIEHAVNIADGDLITLNALPDYINEKKIKNCSCNVSTDTAAENIYTGSLNDQLEQFERRVIIDALEKYDCNVSKTSQKLGIPRQTLYYKMNKLNIKMEKNTAHIVNNSF